MRNITFSPDFFSHYNTWQKTNPVIYNKINDLIINTIREPFKGLGKPEPLKNNWKGYWSRRITDEHRLIYKVENDAIFFVKCHGHYD
jgi:toxin YoeB